MISTNDDLRCPNCLAMALHERPGKCCICEYPDDLEKAIFPPGMSFQLAYNCRPGDRFRWDGEVWIVKALQPAWDRIYGECKLLDATAEVDPTRTAMLTLHANKYLISNAKSPTEPTMSRTKQAKQEPSTSQKLNYLQAQTRLLAQQMDADHKMYKQAFLAIQDHLKAFKDCIEAMAEAHRVDHVILSELLSTQTIQMHQIMVVLQVDGADAMKKGHVLAREMMEKAGLDSEQIEQRQKIRAVLLDLNKIDETHGKMEEH